MTGSRHYLLTLVLGLAPAGAYADGLRGPVTGLVHDARLGAIRRIDGFPGGATVSGGVELGGIEVRQAAFDRAQRLAIVLDAAGQAYLVRSPAGGQPSAEPIESGAAGAGFDRVAIDPEGTVAALYSHSRHALRLVKNLASPSRAETMAEALVGEGAETLSALALLPGEQGALLSLESQPEGGGAAASRIYRVDASGQATEIAQAGAVRGLAVTGSGSGFLLADASRNELVQMLGLTPGAEMRVMASEANGVAAPRGICRVSDELTILVNAGDQPNVMAFDRTGRLVETLPLGFSPQGCRAPGVGTFLQLNEAGRGPLYLLDYSEGLRVLFVPADSNNQE